MKMNLNAYDVLGDTYGNPLQGGYVYVGQPNLDPQTNPLQCYWDAAQTIPARQPFKTVNGRVYNAGTPALLYTSGNFSIQVLDASKNQVFIAANVPQQVDNPVTVAEGGTGSSTAAGALANLGVIAALVMQTYGAFVTTGTAAAYVLNPSPVLAASNKFVRYCIQFHIASGTAPTLAISGLTAKPLKQYNSTGAIVAAAVVLNQISDVVDDGAGNYLLLDPIPIAGGGGSSGGGTAVRHTAMTGVKGADGTASFLAGGVGLTYNIGTAAGVTPLELTFSQGFGLSGPVDALAVISADAVNQGALPPNLTNFLRATYTSSVAVTWDQTKAPPQYGPFFDQNRASVLQFGGGAGSTTFLDDFGPTWAAQGAAKVQNSTFKFGTGGLGGAGSGNALNGTADYIQSTSFSLLGADRGATRGGWSMRGWFNPSALPGSTAVAGMMSASNAGNYGMAVSLYNPGGGAHFGVDGSSDGANNNIAGVTVQLGASVPVVGTWYFVEFTFDDLAGMYRLYLNGVQEVAVASALRACPCTSIKVGAANRGGSATTFFNGFVDKFEILPYCDHPGGTSYLPPTLAPSIINAGYAQDWYDINNKLMKAPTAASVAGGQAPTFGAINRMYVGEADTNGTNVTAVRTYAYNGEYDQTFVTTAVSTSKNHNIGVTPGIGQLLENGITQYRALTLTPLSVTWTAGAALAPGSRMILKRGF